MRKLIFIIVLALLTSCVRPSLPPPDGDQNMRRMTTPLELQDDLDFAPLAAAIIKEVKSFPKRPVFLRFGTRIVSRENYIKGLKRFAEIILRAGSRPEALNTIATEFDFYEVNGSRGWGDAFVTSYFEPMIQGSRKRTPRYSRALYRRPPDMKLSGSAGDVQRSDSGIVETAPGAYFSREDIDSFGLLKGRKLELCWVDPIDAYFLQIQGSGVVVLEDGTQLRLNYADRNGHPYMALGKFLKEVLPEGKLTMRGIEKFLRSLPPAEMQNWLNRNPSYVFFKIGRENAVTAMGLPATAGRTIAADRRYFPLGALAFLSFNKPVFDSPEGDFPSAIEPVGRFVLDQDAGGAIKGGGRVDLFWGRGPEAGRYAGATNSRGKLYYVVPKEGGEG